MMTKRLTACEILLLATALAANGCREPTAVTSGPPTTQVDFLRAKEEYLLGDIDLCEQRTKNELSEYNRDLIRRALATQLFKSSDPELEEACLELTEDESSHPLVELRCAEVLYHRGRIGLARTLLLRADPKLEKLGLLHARAECLCLLVEIALLGDPKAGEPILARLDSALLAYAESENNLAMQRFVFELIYRRYYLTLTVRNKHAFVHPFWQSRKVHDWTRHMLMGWYHRDLAWDIRGGGYAYEVSASAWPRFHEELTTATSHFEKAWKIDPSKPEAAARMIMVTRANKGDLSPKQWFERARSAQFDYKPAYSNYLWALRPRWGGSPEAMLAFAEQCRDTERYDTDVPLFYIDVAWSMISEVEEQREGELDHELREKLYSEIDTILAKAAQHPLRADPRSGLATSIQLQSARLNNAISNSEIDQKHLSLVNRLADELVDTYDVELGTNLNFRARPAREIDEAVVMNDETRKRLDSIGPKGGEDPEVYFAKYEELVEAQRALAESAKDKRAKRLFERLAEESESKIRFFRGEWTPLPFDQDYGAWIIEHGHWQPLDADRVEGRLSVDSDAMTMWSNTSFAGPLELEVEIEPLDFYGPKPCMGLLIGYFKPRNPRDSIAAARAAPNGRCFWLDTVNDLVGANYWAQGEPGHRLYGESTRYKMSVKAWDGFFVVLINDEFMFARKSEGFFPDGYVGLGSVSHAWSSQEARFSNMRVRRLYHEAPPDTDDPDELIAYFDRVLTMHPESSWALSQRGAAQYDKEDFSAAVKDLSRIVGPESQNPHSAILLASALGALGQYDAAINIYEARLDGGGRLSAANGLAWLLATGAKDEIRDGSRALQLAQEVCEATHYRSWSSLDTLAAAFAEQGDFESAVQHQTEAIQLNVDDAARAELQQRLNLYQAKQPYRMQLIDTADTGEPDHPTPPGEGT